VCDADGSVLRFDWCGNARSRAGYVKPSRSRPSRSRKSHQTAASRAASHVGGVHATEGSFEGSGRQFISGTVGCQHSDGTVRPLVAAQLRAPEQRVPYEEIFLLPGPSDPGLRGPSVRPVALIGFKQVRPYENGKLVLDCWLVKTWPAMNIAPFLIRRRLGRLGTGQTRQAVQWRCYVASSVTSQVYFSVLLTRARFFSQVHDDIDI
jgi:hypothetical protein